MKYYIAADGGGTKLSVILYNEKLEIVRTAKTGGTNELFRPRDMIGREMNELVSSLLTDDITEIESLDTTNIGVSDLLIDAIRKHAALKNVSGHGEGDTALLCAGAEYGIVAQAGTGSDAFFIQPDCGYVIGGWGATLGDEGSGYDIGLHTLKAAIYSYDGRAEKSMLTEMVKEHYGIKEMWELVGLLTGNPDHRRLVANLTHITEEAALAGDAAAIKIYEYAAHEMAVQVIAAIKRNNGKFVGPVVTSGGAWKGSLVMARTFAKEIRDAYPGTEIKFPYFEPVVGCIIDRMKKDGIHAAEAVEMLKPGFESYSHRYRKEIL